MRNAPLVSIAVTLTLAVGMESILAFSRISTECCFARAPIQIRRHSLACMRSIGREFAGAFSPADYRAIQQRSQSLIELAAWRTDGVLIGYEQTRSLALEVSCNFFSVYGLTHPLSGRLVRQSECAPGTEIVGIAVPFGFSSGVVRVFRQAPIPLSSTSPVPYGVVVLSLTLAAVAAMIGHARRAARIEPLTALREE